MSCLRGCRELIFLRMTKKKSPIFCLTARREPKTVSLKETRKDYDIEVYVGGLVDKTTFKEYFSISSYPKGDYKKQLTEYFNKSCNEGGAKATNISFNVVQGGETFATADCISSKKFFLFNESEGSNSVDDRQTCLSLIKKEYGQSLYHAYCETEYHPKRISLNHIYKVKGRANIILLPAQEELEKWKCHQAQICNTNQQIFNSESKSLISRIRSKCEMSKPGVNDGKREAKEQVHTESRIESTNTKTIDR
jgi:hypothetical protein